MKGQRTAKIAEQLLTFKKNWVSILIIMVIITGFSVYKYHTRLNYTFVQTLDFGKNDLRDEIDSEDKLQAALREDAVFKDLTDPPKLGSFITLSSAGLNHGNRQLMIATDKVFHLLDVPKWDYKNKGYKFIPNVLTKTVVFMPGKWIENKKEVRKLKTATNYKVRNLERIAVSNIVVMESDNTLRVVFTNYATIRHLDPRYAKNDIGSDIKETFARHNVEFLDEYYYFTNPSSILLADATNK